MMQQAACGRVFPTDFFLLTLFLIVHVDAAAL